MAKNELEIASHVNTVCGGVGSKAVELCATAQITREAFELFAEAKIKNLI